MVTVRIALEEDLHAILEIYNEAILYTTAVYDYEPHTMEMRQVWWLEKKTNGFPVFVAESSGSLIGFATYGKFRNWAGFSKTVECSIFLHTSQRSKGIGKLLMQRLIDAAREQKIHALMGGIDADNLASIKLAEKLGFKEVGHLKEVGFKFDRWLDLKFMDLIIQ
jgi:phosphinothricin acetyltransferase